MILILQKSMTKPVGSHAALSKINTLVFTKKNWNTKDKYTYIIHVLYPLQLAKGMSLDETVKKSSL